MFPNLEKLFWNRFGGYQPNNYDPSKGAAGGPGSNNGEGEGGGGGGSGGGSGGNP